MERLTSARPSGRAVTKSGARAYTGMPPAPRPLTSPAEPDPSRRESPRVGFREAMRLAYQDAARVYLIGLLREVGGEVARAARMAGVKRESLHRLLRRHGVSAAEFRLRRDENRS